LFIDLFFFFFSESNKHTHTRTHIKTKRHSNCYRVNKRFSKEKKFISKMKGGPFFPFHLGRLLLLEDIGQVALATVLTVLVLGHEDTGTTSVVGALATETGDLARLVNLVELEDGHLDLGTLVLDLLGGGVGLLLSLLATTEKLGVQSQGVVITDTIGSKLTFNEGLTGKGQELGVSSETYYVETRYLVRRFFLK
jgi:hypothetical protein